MRRGLVALIAAALVATSSSSPASAQFTNNPLGAPELVDIVAPQGAQPGTATFVIDPARGTWSGHAEHFFGLRLMGSEDIAMTGFTGGDGCELSDFQGTNTPNGWQGAPLFEATSADRQMRMIGGRLAPSCSPVRIQIEFRSTPLIAYYGTFFGTTAAPWHDNYSDPVWGPLFAAYPQWWNLWGTFNELGYSSICVWTGVDAASCA